MTIFENGMLVEIIAGTVNQVGMRGIIIRNVLHGGKYKNSISVANIDLSVWYDVLLEDGTVNEMRFNWMKTC